MARHGQSLSSTLAFLIKTEIAAVDRDQVTKCLEESRHVMSFILAWVFITLRSSGLIVLA